MLMRVSLPSRSTMAVASSAANVVARLDTTGLMQSLPVNRLW